MNHKSLIIQHCAIDASAQVILSLTASVTPQPAAAAAMLAILAAQVRDHLAVEDAVIYATVAAVRDTRHGAAAVMSAAALDALKRDWTAYIYRWDEAAIAADWEDFARDSQTMLGRLRERVAAETAVLYALAEHCGVIVAGD